MTASARAALPATGLRSARRFGRIRRKASCCCRRGDVTPVTARCDGIWSLPRVM